MSEERNEVGTRAGNAADDLDSTFQLISRARTGDQAAIEQLFARHLKPLQRWASGRLPKWARDLADTDDLVQEALLQTFKKIEDFEPPLVGALRSACLKTSARRWMVTLEVRLTTSTSHPRARCAAPQ